MTKTIDTLVEDIMSLFGEAEPEMDRMEAFVHITEHMDDLAQTILARLYDEREVREKSLRMSNVGKKDRQLYYEINGNSDPEELSRDVYMKFLIGDIMEAVLLALAKVAGHTVTDEQKEIEVNGVLGHMDCKIDAVPIDIKTASKFSFRKFYTGEWINNDPFGYAGQLSGYMEAEDATEGGFLVMEKETGQLCLAKVHLMELPNATQRIDHLNDLLGKDVPPSRCYPDEPEGKSGNRVLGRDCGYCVHKYGCWDDANAGVGLRVFDYSNGPKWFTVVAKQPQVQEIK